MSPVHLGIGVVVVALVAIGFATLELNASPDDQHLVVQNDFADADCRLDFANGANDAFSVRKDAEHRKTYKAPREGFINMRCLTLPRPSTSPAASTCPTACSPASRSRQKERRNTRSSVSIEVDE